MTDAKKTRRVLARVAAGEGRLPSVAHPDCTCVIQSGPRRHDGITTLASRQACPVHGRDSDS